MQFLRMCVLVGSLFAAGNVQAAKPTKLEMAMFLGRFVAAAGIAGLTTIMADMTSPEAGPVFKTFVLGGSTFLATLLCFCKNINTPGKTVSMFDAGDVSIPAELNWYNGISAAGAAAIFGIYTYRETLYAAWEKLVQMAAEASKS